MCDFLDNPLRVGDMVATDSPYYKGLVLAKVVGFTPKRIRVEFVTTNNSFYRPGRVILRDRTAVVRVDRLCV